jgi:Lon-like protease
MMYLIKKYRKFLIVITFPYLYLLMLLIMPTAYHGTAPGGLQNVRTNFTIENVEMSSNFNTIYVISYNPLTPFQRFLLENNTKTEVRETTPRQEDTSLRDQHLEGQISKLISYRQSIINAYQLASLVDDQISITYHYEGLFVRYRPSHLKTLNVGDLVVKINHQSAQDFTHEQFLSLAYEEEVVFTVQREIQGEIKEVDIVYLANEEDLPLLFYPSYVITEAIPQIQMPGLDSLIGGPSGGLMQTMALYSSLIQLDLFDLMIAGTGTVEINGQVGRIGGLTQKLFTAERLGVQYFFIPEAHQNEVIDFPFSFQIIYINHINEIPMKLGELR